MATSNNLGGTTAMITSAQASQLLAKLKTMKQNSGGLNGGILNQTIKIQTIQTNSTTGAKQVVTIPIKAADLVSVVGASNTTGVSGGGTKLISVGSSNNQNSPSKQTSIKVVKLPVSSANGNIAAGQSLLAHPHSTATTAASSSSDVRVMKLSTGLSSVKTTFSPSLNNTARVNLSNTRSLIRSQPIFADASTSSAISRRGFDIDFENLPDNKRRKTDKGGKGLRHFSMKVCEKVQAKGLTSYNEVADELVSELTDPMCTSPTDQQYDQKNIRRRVYDALNVLMAMNIISKEKKEIRWLGLPTNSIHEANSLETDKYTRIQRIKAKTQQLQDLILQQIAFKNLVERNKEREKERGAPPAPNSAIQLPFIIVNTSKNTVIDCSISNDKMEYLFNFDNTFEIHDDMEVLKRMGLGFGLERGQVSDSDLARAKSMVPRALDHYVTELAINGPGFVPGLPNISPLVVMSEQLAPNSLKNSDDSEQESESDIDV